MFTEKTKTFRLVQHFLSLIAAGFFFIYLSKNIFDHNLNLFEGLNKKAFTESLLVVMLIWVAVMYILCVSWKNCLQFSIKKKINFNFLCKVYIKSNLAKYLPGGVLNFLARGFLSKQKISKKDIVLSSALEVSLSIISNLIFILTSIAILFKTNLNIYQDFLTAFSQNTNTKNFLYPSLVIVSLLIISIFIANKSRYSIYIAVWNKLLQKKQNILAIFLCNYVIYILEGFCFYLLLHINHNSSLNDFLFITTCLGISSGIGFIVPLVPAGLGIKEASLLLLLSRYYPVSSILISAILMRIGILMIEFILYYLIELKFIHK